MASVVKDPNGLKRIQFIANDGSRKTIRLGKATMKQANSVKDKIEQLVLISTGVTNTIDNEIADWLAGLNKFMYDKLCAVGLVKQRDKVTTKLIDFIDGYIAKRTDVKEGTRRIYRNVKRNLAAFFGEDSIDDITVERAKSFRAYLKTEEGISENTIRRRIAICRQFFNSAIDAEIMTKNPFRGQTVAVKANESRFFYVTKGLAQEVLDALPDAEWRLVFGLARFGGMRCPSEIVRLKWTDIDFDKQRFTVHASKTEHHADGGIRVVPMFPELKPLFQDAFEQAPVGSVYCISRYSGQWSNIGVVFKKILDKAKIKPWPKLFQNCRSTRETELFKMTNGNIKAVCSWIGNTPAVAMQHYAQVTESDLREAATNTVLNEGIKNLAQNPTQQPAENVCNSLQADDEIEFCSEKQSNAVHCNAPVGGTGLEPVTPCV